MSRLFVRIGLRSAIVVLTVVLTMLVMAVAILPSASVADDNHTMNVRGYVIDNHGNKVAGANVTVTMFNGGTEGVSKTATSDVSPKGYFSVNFPSGDWATGNKIRITAEYKGLQALNGTDTPPVVIVNGNNFYTWKNITFPYEISQFGNMTGLLVTAGLVGVVASVALVWRRTSK